MVLVRHPNLFYDIEGFDLPSHGGFATKYLLVRRPRPNSQQGIMATQVSDFYVKVWYPRTRTELKRAKETFPVGA